MKKITLPILLATFLTAAFLPAQTPVDTRFFDRADAFFKKYVREGRIDYDRLQNNQELSALTQAVAAADISAADPATVQAFYINAYNLLVIEGVMDAYPLESVLRVNGFFDAKKYEVAGERLTLNQLEKERLLKEYGDPRFHFVLVCGAVGCPPIVPFAYRPEKLEQQLEEQTRKALNDPQFIRVLPSERRVELSQIFEWYGNDFGGNRQSALDYVNRYRKMAIPPNYRVGFYQYDWSLNKYVAGRSAIDVPGAGIGNNASRYVVSAAIPKGTTETKWFNNLYTQQSGDGQTLTGRATFLTSWLSFLYGVNDRFNAGFDLRYRRVANEELPASPFNVFGSAADRAGVTTVGPKIRWAPVEAWPNFSVQSAFWIPIGSNLEGDGERPFIDWDGASWWTQFFNDFTVGRRFSVFTEIDFFWEDIGSSANGALNRISTPATVILSYFPTSKATIYGLTNFSPFWQSDFDYFAQAGLGAKYQFTPNIELELLYTAFTNEFLQQVNGRASTFNVGLRISR